MVATPSALSQYSRRPSLDSVAPLDWMDWAVGRWSLSHCFNALLLVHSSLHCIVPINFGETIFNLHPVSVENKEGSMALGSVSWYRKCSVVALYRGRGDSLREIGPSRIVQPPFVM